MGVENKNIQLILGERSGEVMSKGSLSFCSYIYFLLILIRQDVAINLNAQEIRHLTILCFQCLPFCDHFFHPFIFLFIKNIEPSYSTQHLIQQNRNKRSPSYQQYHFISQYLQMKLYLFTALLWDSSNSLFLIKSKNRE